MRGPFRVYAYARGLILNLGDYTKMTGLFLNHIEQPPQKMVSSLNQPPQNGTSKKKGPQSNPGRVATVSKKI